MQIVSLNGILWILCILAPEFANINYTFTVKEVFAVLCSSLFQHSSYRYLCVKLTELLCYIVVLVMMIYLSKNASKLTYHYQLNTSNACSNSVITLSPLACLEFTFWF